MSTETLKEVIPDDIPEPLGQPGRDKLLEGCQSLPLLHDGKSRASGILHLLNQTPIEWWSKKQATVETATYGSEFVAGRIAVDQIIDIRTTLRYLGVPVKGKTFLFGDNESVVKSGSIPHSTLNKRHNALVLSPRSRSRGCQDYPFCAHPRLG